ncbi:MAG TPA: multiheme c-type cytochrome [Noviherbaspirillum sp.]|nr:multiheme c-type cytochrome [Noviherbaspirillum sp.]
MSWHTSWHKRFTALALALGLGLLGTGLVEAAKISDVRGTKHNLSASTTYVRQGASLTVPARNIKASSETEICIFCHTPHGTPGNNSTALWNRSLSNTIYSSANTYTSSSMDANANELAAGPGGSSKLCLSCHDGTMGIDKVSVNMDKSGFSSTNNPTIAMVDGNGSALASPARMPAGSGADTGFTRRLGTNLSNDHPISFTYSSTLVDNDGELNSPAAENTVGGIVMNRKPGKEKPVLPLESGKLQCSTCHDPHLRDDSDANAKFLRQNRFQSAPPVSTGFRKDVDIICLACHNKAYGSWAYSAHAHNEVATHSYQTTGSAVQRGFDGKKVWEMACLNCHDTHTVQGARRLLREGTSPYVNNVAGAIQAGVTDGSIGANDFTKSAIENTCYQCHDGSGAIINASGNASGVPNIKAEFDLAGIKMPIALAGENAKHDITSNAVGTPLFPETVNCGTDKKCGADFIETRANLATRHAECTDCHNPHRVIKAQNGLPGQLTATNTKDKAGTHKHENQSGYVHNNLISGVLRGTWGVEPDYQNNPSFHYMPTKYEVKRGDPGSNSNTAVTATYVTREYQICLKCHSNYGYEDDNVYPNGEKRPLLGGTGLTAQNANGHVDFTRYTNQAKEFQAPSTHAVPTGSVSLGQEAGNVNRTTSPATNAWANNHRSWHPVMRPTGRTGRPGAFLSPWNNSTDANNVAGTAGRLGNQTMLCSDCHGSATGTATVMPVGNTNTSENGTPWGPHGSTLNFLLKGTYDIGSGEGDANTLCFKCHNSANYGGTSGGTGFQTDRGDGHSIHSDRIDNAMKCNFCHVAVPHGWKNRSLLVNLLDVGPEAGLPAGTAVSYTNNRGYSNGPYYRKAFLRIISFPAAGSQWREANCNGGSKSTMKTNCEVPL